MYLEKEDKEKLNNMTQEELLNDPDALFILSGLNIESEGCNILKEKTGGNVVATEPMPVFAYSVLVKEGNNVTVKLLLGAPNQFVPEEFPKVYTKFYSEEEALENKMPIFCPPEFLHLLTPTDNPDIQALRDFSREEVYKDEYKQFESDPETPAYLEDMKKRIDEA